MKDNGDVARALLAKGENDLAAARACIDAGVAFDAACFHCQQAAEKFLKSYLVTKGGEFPRVHGLEELVELCAAFDAAFPQLVPEAQRLTPLQCSCATPRRFLLRDRRLSARSRRRKRSAILSGRVGAAA